MRVNRPTAPFLAFRRADAHFSPIIWRIHKAYDTGIQRTGPYRLHGPAKGYTDYANRHVLQ